jgi:hypothetical protein
LPGPRNVTTFEDENILVGPLDDEHDTGTKDLSWH